MSEAEVGSVEERAKVQFEEQLESWMEADETIEVIERVNVGQPELTAELIYTKVLAVWDEFRKPLQPAITRWEKAEDDLLEAEEQVEERVSKRDLWRVGVVTLVTMALVSALVIWLGTNYDSAYFFGFYLVLFMPLYLLGRLGDRAIAKTNLSVDIRKSGLERAEDRFSSALAEQVPIAIREAINAEIETVDDTFRLYDQRGLRELSDPEREVSTASRKALDELITSLGSGSIGLAGSRGAGKTTLIQSFATGRSVPLEAERIGLVVSAPVKYDALEFVLHLFGQLCRRVIGEDGLEEMDRLATRSIAQLRRVAVAKVATYTGFLLMALGTAMLAFHQTEPEGPTQTGGTLLAVGFAAVYVAFLVRVSNDPRFAKRLAGFLVRAFIPGGEKSKPQVRSEVSPEKIAIDRLEEIHFQQSISSKLSGGLTLPFGSSLGGEIGTTATRNPWSLPQAVEEFRRFASSQAQNAYLVIGIDELDKIESDAAAREFLNNVKGVFGVPNCYYLVSVSEDAMSTFERRGLPFRDVFDSSFDAIQRVDFLTLDESRDVLESRVTGLPLPFQYLCHALAGGLPRDLIRVARDLIRVAQAPLPDGSPAPTDLASIAARLVRDEHRTKMAAALTTACAIQGASGDWLAVWLSCEWEGEKSSEGLRRWTVELSESACMKHDSIHGDEEAEGDRPRYEARQIADEVAAFNYYAATVMDLFGGTWLKGMGDGGLDATALGAVKSVAKVRQQFSISPRLAWGTLDELRAELGLDIWADPRGEPGFWARVRAAGQAGR